MIDLIGAAQTVLGLSMLSTICSPENFRFPEVKGVNFTSIKAEPVYGYSAVIPHGLYPGHEAMELTDINFCNVSLQYTHPGWGDNINTQVWLPVKGRWNGRMQAAGGGSFQTGLFEFSMAGAVGQGFSTVSTDGGHALSTFDMEWVLSSPGNINWFLLQNFGIVSINEASIIGKAITHQYYGHAPVKSYFNGCSQGGRQGLMMAQRHPEAFDGILAASPALNLPKLAIAEYWAAMLMHEADEYPAPCEFVALTEAAVDACDMLDGVRDGIISAPELCHYDATEMVGTRIMCRDIPQRSIVISPMAAKVANNLWKGARRSDGSFLWHGVGHDATLVGDQGLANTFCDDHHCKANVFPVPEKWIKYWVKRDASFDVKSLTRDEYFDLFHRSQTEFGSIFANDDTDLTAFHRKGGKMITWHGLADPVIMPNGTRSYYEAVMGADPRVHDYYRYFEAPGVGHCYNGIGPYPGNAFTQLLQWVEDGIAPETLKARSVPNPNSAAYYRDLCPYPKRAKFMGAGDVTVARNFECK